MISVEDEHRVPLEELAKRLSTNLKNGLTISEREKRLNKTGLNILPHIDAKEQEYWETALPNTTLVRIDGELSRVLNRNLVVGDVVTLIEGDIVGADIRILSCSSVTVDMSPLIGYEDSIKKRGTKCTNEDQLNSENMLLASSYVVSGVANGVVVSVGASTIMGRTLGSVESVKKTPPSKRVQLMIYELANQARIWVKNPDVLSRFNHLDFLITPTAGVVTFLSKMVVANIYFDGNVQRTSSSNTSSPTFQNLLRACLLVNASKTDSDRKTIITTNHYETALYNFVLKFKNVEEIREQHPLFLRVPYSRETNLQYSVHKDTVSNRWLLVVEGLPEIILEKCSHIMKNGEECIMGVDDRKECINQMENLCKQGETVYAFAHQYLSESIYPRNTSWESTPLKSVENLCFLGYLSMENPLKPDIERTLIRLQSNQTKIIFTGREHPLALKAILSSVGIVSENVNQSHFTSPTSTLSHGVCFSGNLLPIALESQVSLENSPWAAESIIIGRVTKVESKRQIIEHLKKKGKTVGIIGKRAADALLLKKADLGIAFRGLGPNYMKENSDIVVADNRMSSLCEAIDLVKKWKKESNTSAVQTGSEKTKETKDFKDKEKGQDCLVQ